MVIGPMRVAASLIGHVVERIIIESKPIERQTDGRNLDLESARGVQIECGCSHRRGSSPSVSEVLHRSVDRLEANVAKPISTTCEQLHFK